jgi:hypothetical protein
MKNKLIYFALWLGIINLKEETEPEVEVEVETDQQKIDRLMRTMASNEVWDEYKHLRWGVHNQPAIDRLSAHLLHAIK